MPAVSLGFELCSACLCQEVSPICSAHRLALGADTTAPPKPSVQTSFVLAKMEEQAARDDARWDQVTESLDLLFAKVVEIDVNQQKLDTRFDMSTKVLEKLMKD